MLTQLEVMEIFRTHVPDGVDIYFVPAKDFITTALNNPYIQKQVEIGIYTPDNIWMDFLSPACSYSQFNRLEVCYDLLKNHAVGVDDEDLIRAYIVMMAVHEAHHFHVNHTPTNVEEHAEAEAACLRETTENFPDLSKKAAEFEAQSLTYKRVYDRIRLQVAKKVFS